MMGEKAGKGLGQTLLPQQADTGTAAHSRWLPPATPAHVSTPAPQAAGQQQAVSHQHQCRQEFPPDSS